MRLGTQLPAYTSAGSTDRLTFEEAAQALADAGIRGCLTNFPVEEAEWESTSEELRQALEHVEISLLEYNPSMMLQPADRSGRAEQARKLLHALEIAEEIGCLNCCVCTGGFGHAIDPHPRNRSQESWDLLKETAVLVAEGAASRGLRSRMLVEMVYTTAVWSAEALARFVDEVGSPNVRGHMDVVNTFNFDVVYDHADAVREAFRVLGTRIHTAHLKDVRPMASYFPNIEECYVGEGIMDFRTYLGCLDRMPRGFPAVLEHMSAMDDIGRSYRRMCEIADTLGVAIWDEDEAG